MLRNSSRYSSTLTCSEITRRDAADAARLLPAVVVPEPDFDALSLMQKIALMKMHESPVSRTVVGRLSEDCQCTPSADDYAALREHGLIARLHGKRWDDLTQNGSALARKLETKLCCDFGIHLRLERSRPNTNVNFECSCGGWKATIYKDEFTQKNAHVQFNRHLWMVKRMAGLVRALTPANDAVGA